MFKILIFFIVIFSLFFFGIRTVRAMTNKELLSMAKLLTYSAACAIITVGFLVGFVVLF